jgi:hypothetical protein
MFNSLEAVMDVPIQRRAYRCKKTVARYNPRVGRVIPATVECYLSSAVTPGVIKQFRDNGYTVVKVAQ